MSKKFKIKISRPALLLMLFAFVFNLALCSYAEESNYYDVSDTARPPSAFSICCCLKESDDSFQVLYSCKYLEDEKCPLHSRQYKTTTGDCPSNLIFTKYLPEQNQNSKDN
ncbi:MAG: hypothetical protein A3I68_04045 [Candidatus Melainabacteria bacterium RIFCSPLOWO2_02_FULL_35_15]|nr:MAG: hypothetical protein A3F80_01555 [Candidatus Melainabacteria bacterium RIFCSPLOWO2_12_FULL_35_11]OGI13143.1 MAG: hypothetical protein A3I68_04045 [Candidatus Melainabacteria bacterium RIFCSPLOWO2_02_FULL_35_15]